MSNVESFFVISLAGIMMNALFSILLRFITSRHEVELQQLKSEIKSIYQRFNEILDVMRSMQENMALQQMARTGLYCDYPSKNPV